MQNIFTVLTEIPMLFVAVCGVFSLLVGSFLNVVIYRLPVMMQNEYEREIKDYLDDNESEDKTPLARAASSNSAETSPAFNLVVPRSRCGSCGEMIKAWQNIPVLSYLALGGKCGSCKTSISLRYPAIELATAIVAMLIAWQFQTHPIAAIAGIGLAYALMTLFWIDYDTYLLPDSITLPLIWAGLIANSFGLFTDLQSAVIGAIAGYLILWSVFWAFKIITGKEGMGYGDFKLLAALGAWLGWQYLPVIIVLSSLVGAVFGIAMIIIAGRDGSKPIPFGPYLSAAGLLALLWGETINNAYIALLP